MKTARMKGKYLAVRVTELHAYKAELLWELVGARWFCNHFKADET